MKNLFSYDSPVMQFLEKVCFCCCLNGLWILCSLPIVTMGAATTALYCVSIKLNRNLDGAIFRQYFRSFKDNFKQSTQLWVILLVVGIFLSVDGYVLNHLRKATTGVPAILWTLLLAVIIAAAIIYAILLAYTFPLIAYFENTNTAMLINAFRIGVRYLFVTLLIFAIHILVAYITINLFTPLAIFGEGLCAILSSFFLSTVFYNISGEAAAERAALEAENEEQA